MTAPFDGSAHESKMRERAADMAEVLAWAEGPSPSCDCPDWVDAAVRAMAAEIRRLREPAK